MKPTENNCLTENDGLFIRANLQKKTVNIKIQNKDNWVIHCCDCKSASYYIQQLQLAIGILKEGSKPPL